MTITAADLIRREVHYCASSLIHSLSMGAHAVTRNTDMGRHLSDLTEQALELASPIPDYEEAAREAGWTFSPYPDNSPAKNHEPGYWSRPCDEDEANDEDEDGNPIKSADKAEWACDLDDIEPYDREVFEHWIVSDWLADKLAAKGEKVDKDFAGLTIWARTTTGQAISCDHVIKEITAELND